MAKKCVLKVETCDNCPHFDDEYSAGRRMCEKLCRRIEEDGVPPDCPLPEFSEDFDDET